MLIRDGKETDIIKIARLWEQGVNELHPDWKPNLSMWKSVALKRFSDKNYYIKVVEDDGAIVGFLDGVIYAEPANGKMMGMAQHLMLRKEYRGRGIGHDLVEEGMKFLISKGVDALELYCYEGEKVHWIKKGFEPGRCLLIREVK